MKLVILFSNAKSKLYFIPYPQFCNVSTQKSAFSAVLRRICSENLPLWLIMLAKIADNVLWCIQEVRKPPKITKSVFIKEPGNVLELISKNYQCGKAERRI